MTAADLGLVMAAVGRREPALGGDAVLAPVEAMLARQEHSTRCRPGCRRAPTGAKSGWIPGVSHDVALVRPGEPFVLAVLHDRRTSTRPEVVAFVRRASPGRGEPSAREEARHA